MTWALVISFIIGTVCAARLPVLIFTLIVVLVLVVYVLSGVALGISLAATLTWAVLLAVALEAGCVAMHALLFFLYARKRTAPNERAHVEIKSK